MAENIDNITKSIRDRIVGVLSKDSTPVQNSVVEQVATKVAKEVAPVLVNASNSEPWFQSRIWWGLIIAGVGAISSRYGLVFGINDIQMLKNSKYSYAMENAHPDVKKAASFEARNNDGFGVLKTISEYLRS